MISCLQFPGTFKVFKIPNEYGNYLKQILNNINNDNYIWKVTEDEVYTPNNTDYLFPQEKNMLENIEFMEIISQESYYTFFVNIQVYNKEDKTTIDTYADFLKSSCILILLITDSKFVEVYAKDENILKIIYENASENQFSDIQYIEEYDIKRKIFSAYSD